MSDSKSNDKSIDYIIDATNVCNWHMANKSIRTSEKNEYNANVSLDTLLQLLNTLLDNKKSFQCIFDANTAYNLPNDERDIYNQLLADYKDYFYQVTGGIRADSFVLSIASNYDSRVISNDNFSDYQGTYPWIRRETKPQRLFKGGIPIIAGLKHLVVPELGVNVALNEVTTTLFHKLRARLGFGDGRQDGVIKTFDFKKGNGFIETPSGEEIYFNRSQLNVKEGDKVDFLIKVNNDKKTFAADIVFTQLEQKETDQQMKIWDGEVMSHGIVEWFNDAKGFGVISEEGKEETIFFFRNGYNEDGLPRQGQPVVFEKKTNKKGPHAINIHNGTPENFILKKDIAGATGLGKELEHLKRENASLSKKIDILLPIVKASTDVIYWGEVKRYDNGKGVIIFDGSNLELEFVKSNLSGNIEKSIKPGQRVEFKTILGKKSVKANQIKLTNKMAPAGTKPAKGKDPMPSTNNRGTKKQADRNNQQKGQKKEQNNSRGNQKPSEQNNNKQSNNKQNNNKQNQTKSNQSKQNSNQNQSKEKNTRNQESNRKGEPKKSNEGQKQNSKQSSNQKSQVSSNQKSQASTNRNEPKKTNSRNTAKQPVKKAEPQNNNSKRKEKAVQTNNKAKTQTEKKERPLSADEQYSFNPQKLVYWGRDKKEQNYLVVIRLNEKDRKIDRWLIKESLLTKEKLQRLMNNRAKLNEKDLPQNAKPKTLNFSNRNLTPTGFTSNQDVFISQSWLNWHKQLERKDNFEKMKEEIIKLHNNVKANTYFDGSLENEIIRLRDKVLDMEQEEGTSPQQSKKLNDALGKCYDLLKKKRKKKSIKE